MKHRLPRWSGQGTATGGFTLIELLIVVAIIAILAAIAVPNFLEAQTRAKVSRSKADQRSLATAMESYTVDNNKPIPTFNGTFTPPWGTGSVTEGRQDRFHWLTSPIAYFSSVVYDPFVQTSTVSNPNQTILIIWSPNVWMSGTLPGATANVNYAETVAFKEQQNISSTVKDPASFWTLLSAGPDRDYDVLDAERATVGIQTYDATNGTVSDGDIFRARGE